MSGRRVYFGFSTGIKRPLLVRDYRIRELADIAAWIERWFGWATERPSIERAADAPDGVPPPRRWKGSRREVPRDPPDGWEVPIDERPRWANPDEATLRRYAVESWRRAVCDRLDRQAELVRKLYEDLTEEGQRRLVADERAMANAAVVEWTLDAAADLWHALDPVSIPLDLWTEEHQRRVLERAYEALRGQGDGEYILDGRALSPAQAGSVLWLFENLVDLPHGDALRLAVPRGRDRLASSEEYEWCSGCGAVENDDVDHYVRTCRRKGCDLRKEHAERAREEAE